MPVLHYFTADFSAALAVVANLDDALALGRKEILVFNGLISRSGISLNLHRPMKQRKLLAISFPRRRRLAKD
jgi:hypothetical protein